MEDGLMLATFFRSRNRDITALAKYDLTLLSSSSLLSLHVLEGP